jgi:hypothetical protein
MLFRRVLLDTSNILLANDKNTLIQCCEAIKTLIFPYKYEQVNVSYLPKALMDRVDAPFIFLLGVERQHYKESYIKDGTYIIDLDQNKISQIPHTSVTLKRTGTNKILASEDLPDLPKTLVKRLKWSINDIAKKAYKTKEMSEEAINTVRLAFFQFFMEPLKHLQGSLKPYKT